MTSRAEEVQTRETARRNTLRTKRLLGFLSALGGSAPKGAASPAPQAKWFLSSNLAKQGHMTVHGCWLTIPTSLSGWGDYRIDRPKKSCEKLKHDYHILATFSPSGSCAPQSSFILSAMRCTGSRNRLAVI